MFPHNDQDLLRDLHSPINAGRLENISGNDIINLIHLSRYDFAASFTSGQRVLDIACGIGYGSYQIASLGNAILTVGADISPDAIQHAQRNFQHSSLRYRLIDGQELPFEANSFDVVVSFETIEHVANHNLFLSEIKRVMRCGGLLVISTPNKSFHSLGRKRPWNPYHVREFYPDDFFELLTKYFSKIVFRGGQEFLPVSYSNLLKHNWIEIRHYNIIRSNIFIPLISMYRKSKNLIFSRRLTKAKPTGGSNLLDDLKLKRCKIEDWIDSQEPYTLMAVCEL